MCDIGVGDRVRIDIPDETDTAHHRYHGRHGTVIAEIPVKAEPSTGSDGHDVRFRVDLDGGSYADFSIRDLRPPIIE